MLPVLAQLQEQRGKGRLAPVPAFGRAQMLGHFRKPCRLLPAYDRDLLGPALQQRQGQVRAGPAARDAEQFLVRALTVEGDDLAAPLGPRLHGPRLALLVTDALVQAVIQRPVEVAAQQAVRLTAGAHVLHQGVEGVLVAVMGRDHEHLAAPDQEREGRLVDDDQALHAAQGPGHRGQGHDLVGGCLHAKGLDVPLGVVRILEDRFPDVRGAELEQLAPVAAVFDELPGHLQVVAHVENVHAAVLLGLGGMLHGDLSGRPGVAGAPALLDHDNLLLADGLAQLPLVGEEPGRLRHTAPPSTAWTMASMASPDTPDFLAAELTACAAFLVVAWAASSLALRIAS